MSSCEDDELEFIGHFEKIPNVLAEITIDDEIESESDPEISIIEVVLSKIKAKNGSVKNQSKPNSYVKMSSHQKQLHAQSKSQQLNPSQSQIIGGVKEVVIVDGEQNDNNEFVVTTKNLLKKKRKRKRKKEEESNPSQLKSNEGLGEEDGGEDINKKNKKKLEAYFKSKSSLLRNPVFVLEATNNPINSLFSLEHPSSRDSHTDFIGKVLNVIPLPSLVLGSTTLNVNQNTIPIVETSAFAKDSSNNNINQNDNLEINSIYHTTLNIPKYKCVSDNLTSIKITSPNNYCLNRADAGDENSSRRIELVQIPKLTKHSSHLESNDDKYQNVEYLRGLELRMKKDMPQSLDEFQPEAQSMNHFIKRLGISKDDHRHHSLWNTIEEDSTNDEELVVRNIKRKRSASRGDGEGNDDAAIPITDTDYGTNTPNNKKQAFIGNWRIDKNPEDIEQSGIEEVINYPSFYNKPIKTPRKDCFEKDYSILMGPPLPKNLLVQNLLVNTSSNECSSLTEGNPNPWDPIVIRETTNNNKLGLPNSWTQDVIDFYNKPSNEDFELNSVFRLMRDSPRLWKAPYENISMRRKYYNTRCRICSQRDHETRCCPERGKLPVCTNCGLRGHKLRGVKGTPLCCKAMCLNCGSKSSSGFYERKCQRCEFTRYGKPVLCSLCGMKGHIEQVCPDQWRRYHKTTIPLAQDLLNAIPTSKELRGNDARADSINKPEYRPESKLYCSNCARRHHSYFHCQRSLYSKYVPNKPYVIVDLPPAQTADIYENEKSLDQNSKGFQSALSQLKDVNKQIEQDVAIFLNSNPYFKIGKEYSSGSNSSTERLCPSYSISYEISKKSSASSYASGYSKKNLEIVYSADLPKSKSDVKELESNITFPRLTNDLSKNKYYSRSAEVKSPRKRVREVSRARNNSVYEHSSKKPAYHNSVHSPIKWSRDSSRSNQRYYNSYKSSSRS